MEAKMHARLSKNGFNPRVYPRNRIQTIAIRGLPNPGVSCYANVVVQFFANCDIIQQVYQSNPEYNAVSKVIREYFSSSPVDVMSLRKLADEGLLEPRYSLPRQQDVAEFLMDLCNRSKNLCEAFEHQLTESYICQSCVYEQNETTRNLLFSLSLPPHYQRCDLQDIINYNIQPHEIDRKCQNKGCLEKLRACETLSNVGKILIIQLKIFEMDQSLNVHKIRDFLMDKIVEEVRIGEIKYRVESIIFHHGHNIGEGHYTSIFRSRERWISANDNNIHPILWQDCRGNPYVIFLKRCNGDCPYTLNRDQDTEAKNFADKAKVLDEKKKYNKRYYKARTERSRQGPIHYDEGVIGVDSNDCTDSYSKYLNLQSNGPNKACIDRMNDGNKADVEETKSHVLRDRNFGDVCPEQTSDLLNRSSTDYEFFDNISSIEMNVNPAQFTTKKRKHDHDSDCEIIFNSETVQKKIWDGQKAHLPRFKRNNENHALVSPAQLNINDSNFMRDYSIRTSVTFQLDSHDKKKILDGSWFNDLHIDKFLQMIQSCSDFEPRSLYLLDKQRQGLFSGRVRPVDRNSHHMQILHSCEDNCVKCLGGHWVCMYYDTCRIYIYDSLNQRNLHGDHEFFLKMIFPFFDQIDIVFPRVQSQNNSNDCGPMAMAFCTSIIFGIDPCKTIYDRSALRKHVYYMFEYNLLAHFPTVMHDDQQIANHNAELANSYNSGIGIKSKTLNGKLKASDRELNSNEDSQMSGSTSFNGNCNPRSKRRRKPSDTENTSQEQQSDGRADRKYEHTLKTKVKLREMKKKYNDSTHPRKALKSQLLTASKIKKKYIMIGTKLNTDKFIQKLEYYVDRIAKNLNTGSLVERIIEARNLALNAIYSREGHISQVKYCLKTCQKKMKLSLIRLGEIPVAGNEEFWLAAICGTPYGRHVSSAEPFFNCTVKNSMNLNLNDVESREIVVNQEGQIMNIFPITKELKKGGKIWECTGYCKEVDPDVLIELRNLFKDIVNCTHRDVYDQLEDIDKCTASSSDPMKRGHPISCYIQPLLCESRFLKLTVLSSHYPLLRTIKRMIYKLKNLHAQVHRCEIALENGDIEELKLLKAMAKKTVIPSRDGEETANLVEDEIAEKFRRGIKAFEQISSDPPTIPCISCQRLFSERQLESVDHHIQKFDEVGLELRRWEELMALYDNDTVDSGYICKFCIGKFKKDELPSTCIMNNMMIKPFPDELKDLNMYEKMLCQRAKAFQVIVKKGTVMKKNIPHRDKIDCLKGRTFHLPLPLEKTLKKICKDTNALNVDHEVFILVRGHPTKNKAIWEDYVDVNKICKALEWYKANNPFFENIIIPSPSDLLGQLNSKSPEFIVENRDGGEDDDGQEEAIVSAKESPALLTCKSQSDPYYEQFSIHPLYSKNNKHTDVELYQMLKVHALAMDNRQRDLDVLCFPDLYCYGEGGQHADREVRLREYDFVRCRLTSVIPNFRLNIQYLFYCLNQSHIRQINAGIFHKLNVTDGRMKYTAKELIENLEKNKLESNLNTIFSRIRGTEAYWKRVRFQLEAMDQEYGPMTFFITLSPAEWNWSGLAIFICNVNGWKQGTKSVSQLVAADPVSASIYIENQFQAVIAYIRSKDEPIGPVEHFHYSREYQGRGLPHFHCFFWIKDAPIYGVSSNEEVRSFILKYITCKIPNRGQSPNIHRRVMSYQLHKDNNYCLRQIKTNVGHIRRCRFGYPRPVSTELTFRSISVAISNHRKLKNKSRFYDLPRGLGEQWINDYIPQLLYVWEGNMDAQFIGESSHLLSKYVTKYGTKGEKSVVDFSDIKSNLPLYNQLWSYAFKALDHRDCGALEAADTLLGHHLHGTDPDTVFRWLDIREIRSRKLKPYSEITKLPPESEDLFFDSLIDTHYPSRPSELESTCLYDFAKHFDVHKDKPAYGKIGKDYFIMKNGRYCKERKRPYIITHYRLNATSEPEKHAYSLLLLFKPWRDTDELKGDEANYQAAYKAVQPELVRAMQYHDKCEVMRKAMEDMNQLVQQELEKSSEKDEDDVEEVPEGCVPIVVEEAMKDFHDANENQKDNEYLQDAINHKFNPDQKRIFEKVRTGLDADGVLRLFISGFGGTGKSFLIEVIKLYNKLIRGKDSVVLAPTGLAAYNVSGLTIHRLLSIPVDSNGTAKYQDLSRPAKKQIKQTLANVDLIIVDEISMVSNIILMYIHLRLTNIFDTSEDIDGWFGKLNIIVLGDLLQLPPVKEDFPFEEVTKEKMNEYVKCLDTYNLWHLFEYDELTMNMRQKDDAQYSQILSNIRLGFVTPSDIKILNERRIILTGTDMSQNLNQLCDIIIKLPTDTVCLFSKKNMCQILNQAMLDRLDGDEVVLVAEDCFKCPKNLQKKISEALSEEDKNQCGIERVLHLKIGSKIMIRRNIDVSIGLVNGTIGTVTSFSKDKDGVVEHIIIKLKDGKEYPIKRLEFKFVLMDKIYVLRKQFPVCLSYGMTIHKSQGLSLESAVVDVGNSIFDSGQTYVALSRVKSLAGLYLINFDPSKIMASDKAVLEYNRLRSIFRPDLKSFDSSNRMQHETVRDHHWCISDSKSLQVQVPNDSSFGWSSHGLPNSDGTSDYSNAIVQVLFHSVSIRRALHYYKTRNSLSALFHEFVSKSIVSMQSFRMDIDKKYALRKQQNASEFLINICNKFEIIRQVLAHEAIVTKKCLDCSKERYEIKSPDNCVLTLNCQNDMQVSTLQELFDSMLDTWYDIDERCKLCGRRMRQNLHLEVRSPVIVVQISPCLKAGEKFTIQENVRLNEISKSKIRINHNTFKVVSGVFQSKNTLHYVSMLRDDKHWIEIDDDVIRKKSWPKGSKDVCLLFLEVV